MAAGYSGTPLVKKLGIKAGNDILLVNTPDHYMDLLGTELPDDLVFQEERSQSDFIHFFTKEHEELDREFSDLKKYLDKNGMIWVSWPKKASKVPTSVDEALVRRKGLELGLVDVKICAVDETWSGLKFVYRKKDR